MESDSSPSQSHPPPLQHAHDWLRPCASHPPPWRATRRASHPTGHPSQPASAPGVASRLSNFRSSAGARSCGGLAGRRSLNRADGAIARRGVARCGASRALLFGACAGCAAVPVLSRFRWSCVWPNPNQSRPVGTEFPVRVKTRPAAARWNGRNFAGCTQGKMELIGGDAIYCYFRRPRWKATKWAEIGRCCLLFRFEASWTGQSGNFVSARSERANLGWIIDHQGTCSKPAGKRGCCASLARFAGLVAAKERRVELVDIGPAIQSRRRVFRASALDGIVIAGSG